MNQTELANSISKFPYWHYPFEFEGHLTPVPKEFANRHTQRKKYFFDPLIQHLGGSLKGKRVLDLGCNAGFWSLCAIEAGCDVVVGIDGRPYNIAQARFVFDVKGIDPQRYRFECANLFDLDLRELGTFDLVLCLGLLYHISKPITLLEKIAQVNRDILVIDTQLSKLPGRLFEIAFEPIEGYSTTAVDYELVLYPTRQAVLDMAQNFGYSAVILKPGFSYYAGAGDYKKGSRRAFICAKHTNLSHLSVETEQITFFSRVGDIMRLERDYAREAWRLVKNRIKRRPYRGTVAPRA